MDARKVGKYAMIGGAIVAGVGAAMWAYGRRSQSRLSGLGDPFGLPSDNGFGYANVPTTNVVRKGGMVLKHRRKGKLPIKERVGIMQDLVWEGVQDPQMRELALAITGKGTRNVTVGKYTFDVKGANCPARDGECEARAVYNWVRENIRYTGDIGPVKMGRNGPVEAIDLFQSAKRTIEFGGGDCDDHADLNATLMASLAALNGLHAKFRASDHAKKQLEGLAGEKISRAEFNEIRKSVKHRVTSPRSWGEFTHVYTVVGLPKNSPQKWVAMDTTLPGNYFAVEAPHRRKQDFDA